jgi:photosystem II stability/assembly factor-like uncharacterized protein
MRRTQGMTVAAAMLASAAAMLAARDSHANGRPPATTNVRFQPDDTETIYLPVTFGLLVSSDGGESFRWVCETAIGYGGTFDPDYAIDADGAIYATTFKGLRVSRDQGCTWETLDDGISPTAFLSEVEIGPDGRVWAPTSTGQGPNDVFVSTDGTSFVSSNLPVEKDWWISIRTTPADVNRLYVSGFTPPQGSDIPAQALLRRSDDGGQKWTELSVDGFTFGDQPRLYVVGVSPMQADVVFARAVAAVEPFGDALYRSQDAGVTWEKKIEFNDTLSAFHIRPDGQTVIAATVNGCPGDSDPLAKGCVQISHDGGVTWALAAEQPRLACLDERSDGTLFGCGANWEPDNFSLGSSTDGESWEKVYRFSETAGPLECESGTEQAECAALTWPGLCEMFGICVRGPDAGPPPEMSDGGCCSVESGSDTDWIPGVLVVLVALAWGGVRRRRR